MKKYNKKTNFQKKRMPSPSPAGRITWPMKVAPRLPCPPLSLRVRRGFHRCPKWRSPRHEMRDQNGWELRWFWWIHMGQGRYINFNILRGFKGVGICNCADGLEEIHESWIASCWVLGCYHLSFLVWDSQIVIQALRAGFGMTSCFVLSPLFSSAWQRFMAKCGETSCYPRSQAVHQHCNPSSLFQTQYSLLVFGMSQADYIWYAQGQQRQYAVNRRCNLAIIFTRFWHQA